MLGFLKKLIGDKSQKDEKEYLPYIEQTNTEFKKLDSISDDELRKKTQEFKNKIQNFIKEDEETITKLNKEAAELPAADLMKKEELYDQVDKLTAKIDEKIEEVLKEILPEAFAVIKETSRRLAENKQLVVTATERDKNYASKNKNVKIEGDKAIWFNEWDAAGTDVKWEMVHYDVQLMGGAVLHNGNIAEMQTGEGKTLVATLPVYLNALAGKGVHVVTVNNYLAKRDAQWMGPIFEFHGMTIDCIDNHSPNSEERRQAYLADITYGTNNEFGFDYLRDNMSSDPDQLVQKKHHYAIIDEVDSVLIDEARTPLIISGPTSKQGNQEYNELKPKIEVLFNAQKKYVTQCLNDAKKGLQLLDDEKNKKANKEKINEANIALLRAHRGLPKIKALIKFLSEPGMRVQLQKTENYYMQDQQKEMHKIDKELYFVIDEKNNTIDLTEKGIDLISKGEDSSFYLMPDIGEELAQLDQKDLTKEDKIKQKDEILREYSIKSERIHTMNQLLKAYTLFEKEVDYVLMDSKVKIVDEQTGRIMEGRRYSDGLHQAIEAKENVKIEAATQTYATITLQNYFRMYHKLSGMTGTAETEAQEFWDIYELDVVVIPTNRPLQRNDQQDLVYKTAREKYNAIIEEIERLVAAGRPVLVGTTTVEISELLSRMLKMKGIDHEVLNAKHHQREAEIVAKAGQKGSVTIATNMAGRGTDIKLGEGVKENGGLAIVGTERHDSRRVDRQLRGRAGRQGDPGSSQFFVSLEDNLMRLFGSERIAKMMDRLGMKEGDVIQHKMITRSIEKAQKKVEENNFGIRKRLLEYDDVMSAQRKAIYKKRKNALYGEKLSLDIQNMFYDVAETIVLDHQAEKDFESFEMDLYKFFSIESPVSANDFATVDAGELSQKVYTLAIEKYERKNEMLVQRTFPAVKQVLQNESNTYKNIAFPITDGSKTLNVIVNLEEAEKSGGKAIQKTIEKNITLGLIDNEWKEHLREMDDLRQSVQQAVYEQKDPLLIYKLESFKLFKEMTERLNKETSSFLMLADLPTQEQEIRSTNEPAKRKSNYEKAQVANTSQTQAPEFAGSDGYAQAKEQSSGPSRPPVTQPIKAEKTVGRNDPCPCGSGKKYKQCHGK